MYICIINFFLHDIPEDYGVSYEQLLSLFGEQVANSVWKMSKVRHGVKLDDDIYYDGIISCPLATVSKTVDRLHNLMSMLGGFTPEKRVSYIAHTLDKVVPMMKEARRKFPEQEGIYENAKYVMTNQINLYNEINKILLNE